MASLSVIYAVTVSPKYQVSSILRPAAINELDALKRSNNYLLSLKDALSKVGAALESYDTRLSFFSVNKKRFQSFERRGWSLEQSLEDLNRNPFVNILSDSTKQSTISANMKVEMSYPTDGVAILNDFVNYASEHAQVVVNLREIMKSRLEELGGRLAAARPSYTNKKESEIASLEESDSLYEKSGFRMS